MIRTALRRTGLGLAAIITALTLFLGIQSLRLGWWFAEQRTELPELTPAQKAEDMRYLLQLTREVSSADAAWRAGGLDNPLDHEAEWIARAEQTPDNTAFVDLILQYSVHLQQVGHGFLAYDYGFSPADSLIYDIPRQAFERMPLWRELIARLPWYAYGRLELNYQQGQYVVASIYRTSEHEVPVGAIVRAVDGQPVDTFVLNQQYRDSLHYDPLLQKWFLYPLLKIDPGVQRVGWEVTFELPDGSIQTLLVRKNRGLERERPEERLEHNIRCIELADDTLYVRIASFDYYRYADDARVLRECFAATPYGYNKLILDVRGNRGGEIWSYMDNLIAPLARAPLTYDTTTAVKEGFYTRFGWRFPIYQWLNSNELTDPHTRITNINAQDLPGYSDQGWRVRRITRQIEPAAEAYPFDGRIYLLIDQFTLSAGDSFAAAMQRSGLATVVGHNTNGLGEAYQAKTLYALPNSGIMLFMESELTFNPDGSLNNVVGTQPDLVLDPSTYPTPFPRAFSASVVRDDPWVQWVLQQQ